ncbi:hypothetical protein A0H76_1473 [Hepatospora eriocheir]|uniref:Uncharacterized protein n=1 Tax=Hepatospora eriocheir TaxID=1081669 RepID=A0A1X0QBR0_9MICR|nr:hypothetical protein HERIO_971 [Hepatospora eriocheir]ORD99061.1 hypothetical protein A0H76_1473 [Hepatospora eriocheir]
MEEHKINKQIDEQLHMLTTHGYYDVKRYMIKAEAEIRAKMICEERFQNIENDIEDEMSIDAIEEYKGKRFRYTNGYSRYYDVQTDEKQNFEEDIFEIEGGRDAIDEILQGLESGDKIVVNTKRRAVKGTLLSIGDDMVTIRNSDRRRVEYSFRQIVENGIKFKKDEESE